MSGPRTTASSRSRAPRTCTAWKRTWPQPISIHDATFRVGQPFRPDTHREPLDHRQGPVRRQHFRAKARRRQAQAAGSRRDVQEPVDRLQASQSETLIRERRLAGRDELVVARGDRVPPLRWRHFLVVVGSVSIFVARRVRANIPAV